MNQLTHLGFDTLAKIVGDLPATGRQADNAMSFLSALDTYGGRYGLDKPHRVAMLLGQVLLESGEFRYDRELWGPTPAQVRYDTRTDLGNTPERDGDGAKYKGRGPIQITGKYNYGQFTKWARKLDKSAPDFVADPDAVNSDPWEGLVAVWFWSENGLNAIADDGLVRAVTRRINGGYNHLTQRETYTTRARLVLLGYGPADVREFQRDAGLDPDNDPGPLTQAALHDTLKVARPFKSPDSAPVPPGVVAVVAVGAFTATVAPWFCSIPIVSNFLSVCGGQ